MSEEDREAQHELVVPFVTVTSKGGPHDDDSYVAGYEMGLLDAWLEVSRWPTVRVVRTANRPQAELLAMRHGFNVEVEAYAPDSQWSTLHLTPVEEM